MNNDYDLKMRLAVRIADIVTDEIRWRYSDDQVQLVFDSLSDGLASRTEDELLSLVKPEGGLNVKRERD